MPTLEEIQASIDSLSIANDSIDFVTLASQAVQETSYISYSSVKTVDMLPDLFSGEIPNGHMIYVEEVGGPVLSSDKQWISLISGQVVRSDGSKLNTYIWGYNEYGQLGIGSRGGTICNPLPTPYYFCSFSHENRNSSGVTLSGCYYTTGCNDQSQLGVGVNPPTLCDCSSWVPLSDGAIGGKWCQPASGRNNQFGITTDGKFYSWGWSGYGLGGDGGNTTSVPTLAPWANCTGCVWCAVYTGETALILIKSDGSAWGAGFNGYGNLGVGDTCTCTSCLRPMCGGGIWNSISMGGTWTAGTRTDGSLLTWGRSYYQNLGLGCGNNTSVLTPTGILGGGTTYCKVRINDHTGAAVKTDGTLWTWGYNNSWAMGIGCCNNCCFSSPVQVAGGRTDWCDIGSASSGFSAITSDGRLWGWGANSYGQIGDGTTISRCSPTVSCSSSTWIAFGKSHGTDATYHAMASRVI